MANPLCHSTTVTYNKIEIRNVLTESMDTTTVYDATGVDPIGIRVKMTFTGEVYAIEGDSEWLHGHTWQAAPEQLPNGLYNVINKFLQPRQKLVIKIGNDTLFDVRPGGVATCGEPAPVSLGEDWEDVDISNGPRSSCQVLAIKGGRTAKCRFSVEFTTQSCQASGHILNIRWRVHDDIDCRTWLTKRTYEGVIRFRARIVGEVARFLGAEASGNPFHLARQRAFPPLLRGFRRETVAYHEEASALEISFIVIDQEVYSSAPSPATFWEGTYTVTMAQNAVTCTQNLTFSLKGDPTVRKTDLITLATYIIDSKLQMKINRAPGEPAPNFLLLSSMFQEDLAENRINVSVTTWSALITGNENAEDARYTLNLSQGDKFTLGQTLPENVSNFLTNPYSKTYDPKVSTIPARWPQEVSYLLCGLQNPCCVSEVGGGPIEAEPAAMPSTYSAYSRQEPITYSLAKTLYSESHTKSSYEYYKMSSDLIGDTGWRAFPLGKQCSSTDNESTVAFSHIHCPVQIRKITINAMRINSWPELPKPIHWKDDTANPPIKHILKDYTIEPMPVQLSADGCDTIHEVVATYYYYLDKPYQVGSSYKIPAGRVPYISKAKLAAANKTTEGGVDADKQAIASIYFIHPKELLATTL